MADAKPNDATRAPRMGERGFLPDEDAILRDEFRKTTLGQRVAQTIALSRTVTKIAARRGR